MNGGLSVGKIYAELEFRDRLTAGLEKAVRDSQRAGRAIGVDLAAGAKTAADGLASVGVAADKTAERVERSGRVYQNTAADMARIKAYVDRQMTAGEKEIEAQFRRTEKAANDVIRAQERVGDTTVANSSRASDALGGLGRALIGAFAVERVVAFGREVVTMAGDVADAAAATGLSTTEVQRFGYAAKQAGSDMGAVTSAVTTLSDRLVEGKTGTIAALNEAGLSLERIRAMRPGEAFETVAEAVARIPDPMQRSQVALELLGGAGKALLPAMEAGIKSTADEAERLGVVISEQDIVALDNLGDAWDRTMLRAKAATAGMLSDAVRIGEGIASMIARVMAPGPVGQRMANAVTLPGGGNPLVPLQFAAAGASALADYLDPKKPMAALAPMASHAAAATRLMASHGAEVDKVTTKIRQQGRAVAEQAIERLKLTSHEQAALRLQATAAIGWEEYAGNVELAQMQAWALLQTVRLVSQTPIAEATNPYNAIGLQGAVAPSFLRPVAASVGDTIKLGISSALMDLPALFTQAFTGGGGVSGAFKALGVQIADAIMTPLVKSLQQSGRLTGRGMGAVSAGAAGAGALGGAFGGSTGATIGSLTSTIAGVALATTGWGIAAATTTAGMIALGAATLGIGVAAVGVYLLAKKFFTVSKEVKQARADVQAFQEELWKTMTPMQVAESAGQGWAATLITVRDAYMRMGYSAEQAESVVDKLLDTSRPEAARQAMAQINDVVGRYRNTLALANEQMGDLLTQATEAGQRLPESLLGMLTKLRDMGDLTQENIDLLDRLLKGPEVDWKKYEEAAGRYGIDPNALGQGFQQSKATATAQQMVDDVDLLLKGGATMGTILHGMREEISALVQDSLQFGTTLPENMKPWIDELARTGQLVDQNGEAITDLARLNFAESLETSFQRIANSIQALVDLLNGPLQSAFGSIPKNVGVNVDVTTPTDSTHIYDRGTETTGFAGGTIAHGSWFRNFKGGTPTVLHGEEAVVRKDQVGAFVSAFGGDRGGASGGRGGERPVVLKLRDNRILAEVVAAELDGLLARRGVRR